MCTARVCVNIITYVIQGREGIYVLQSQYDRVACRNCSEENSRKPPNSYGALRRLRQKPAVRWSVYSSLQTFKWRDSESLYRPHMSIEPFPIGVMLVFEMRQNIAQSGWHYDWRTGKFLLNVHEPCIYTRCIYVCCKRVYACLTTYF